MRAILSITLLLLVGVLANGQDGPVKPVQPSPEPTKLDVIQKQLNDLTITLQALQASEKAGENAKRLTKVENEVLNLKDAIARLESAINAMKVDERRSFYGNPITPVPATDAPKTAISAKPIVEAPKVNVTVGTLKLVNSTTKGAQVLLNGQAYKVEAGQTVIVPGMPTGEFTYEVTAEDLGVIQAMVSRKLSTAETFTVYIYPR